MEKAIDRLMKIKSEGKLRIDPISGAYGKGVMIEAASPYAKMPFFCDEANGAIIELENGGIKFDAPNRSYLVIATEAANRSDRKKFLCFYNKLVQGPKPPLIKREQLELNALLFGAAVNGKIDEAEYILNEGADVNAKDDQGKTALMHAAFEGHKEMVELLRKAGAKK